MKLINLNGRRLEVKKGEIKAPGKIYIPRPNITSNHDHRRNTRRVAAKMLEQADAYILVMWKRNGKPDSAPEPPIGIVDVKVLNDNQSIIGKVMGKIGQHTLACLRYCNEQLKMTEGQRAQADLVAKLKQERSQELSGFIDDGEAGEPDDTNEPDPEDDNEKE